MTIFKPTVEYIDDEYAFITKPPHEIVASGNFSNVPWIAGVNSDEGLITAAGNVQIEFLKYNSYLNCIKCYLLYFTLLIK